jgi:aryl-alcohol dehydrogenase-like predicted oxidoreductase
MEKRRLGNSGLEIRPLELGFRILGALDRVAEKHRSTTAAVALAWLIARPGITALVASATNIDQLNEWIEATRIGLDPSSIEELNLASAWT